MPNPVQRALWSSNRKGRGLTLIELLVVLLILSILAAAAFPYAELALRRDREVELRRALREIRVAMDVLHDDWLNGRLSKNGEDVSEDGYPKKFRVLVDGADTSGARGGKRKYLRRIPRDPFGDPSKPTEEHWALRGYQDESDSVMWGGKDVYDVHSMSDEKALDGTRYKDW